MKVLIVIHRTLREGDPTFREELLNYSHRRHILRISNFKDDTSPLGNCFHFFLVFLRLWKLDLYSLMQLGIALHGLEHTRSFLKSGLNVTVF